MVKSKLNSNKNKSVDQKTISKEVAQRLGMNVSDVVAVIEQEQKQTMAYVKRGFKVVKKNYLTITSIELKGRKWISPLDGKEYVFPDRKRLYVRIGEGFKNYINGTKKMPEKICRFVGNSLQDEDINTAE